MFECFFLNSMGRHILVFCWKVFCVVTWKGIIADCYRKIYVVHEMEGNISSFKIKIKKGISSDYEWFSWQMFILWSTVNFFIIIFSNNFYFKKFWFSIKIVCDIIRIFADYRNIWWTYWEGCLWSLNERKFQWFIVHLTLDVPVHWDEIMTRISSTPSTPKTILLSKKIDSPSLAISTVNLSNNCFSTVLKIVIFPFGSLQFFLLYKFVNFKRLIGLFWVQFVCFSNLRK